MNLKSTLGILLFCWSSISLAADSEKAAMTEEEKYIAWASNLWNSLDRKTGTIKVDKANAILNVPKDFYFLNSKDSAKVLVDIWGNPPGQTPLGMLFPAEMTPFDNGSWAVTIEYEAGGYVSDSDADEINYKDLLNQMKESTAESNVQRVQQGYGTIELVGWASPPYYDSNEKKLHWAKEIKFESAEVNTLNYNIRILGRKGVLVLNFIADMSQKAEIDSKIDTVLAIAQFDQGAQYSDFDPSVDEVAAYGLGALVAGKVIAKTGFLAVALVFLKKFWIFIVLGIGALIKGLFSRSKKLDESP